jgi:hypothetical protein
MQKVLERGVEVSEVDFSSIFLISSKKFLIAVSHDFLHNYVHLKTTTMVTTHGCKSIFLG